MKILCTKNFIMEDGDCAFTAGKTYEFDTGFYGWQCIDDQGDHHWMSEDDIAELQEVVTVENQVIWYVINPHNGWDSLIGMYATEELADRSIEAMAYPDECMKLSSILETEKLNWIEE